MGKRTMLRCRNSDGGETDMITEHCGKLIMPISRLNVACQVCKAQFSQEVPAPVASAITYLEDAFNSKAPNGIDVAKIEAALRNLKSMSTISTACSNGHQVDFCNGDCAT